MYLGLGLASDLLCEGWLWPSDPSVFPSSVLERGHIALLLLHALPGIELRSSAGQASTLSTKWATLLQSQETHNDLCKQFKQDTVVCTCTPCCEGGWRRGCVTWTPLQHSVIISIYNPSTHRASLCRPGCPWTSSVYQAGLDLRDLLASAWD